MSTARLVVAEVGPLVTLQDRGRPGLMRFGVPASGPMDRGAYDIAHAALGAASPGPAVEISLGGLTLDCVEGAVTVAVAGGGFAVEIDKSAHGSWLVATLRSGSRLSVRRGPWGSWTYLAFAGRLKARSWLGGCATHGPSDLGGGRLAAGQELEVEAAETVAEREGEIACPVWARPRHEVKIVLGPQDRFFSADTLELLLAQSFAMTDAYNRMGVRLSGPSLLPNATLDMPSEAIVRGSVQVAGDGVATVLLADHQTTGGYPKIATLVSDQVDSFVQHRGRQSFRFVRVSAAAALESVRTRRLARQRLIETLRLS